MSKIYLIPLATSTPSPFAPANDEVNLENKDKKIDAEKQDASKNKENIIKLEEDSYIDSFIENMSDLLIHYHKTKYLERSVLALGNIINILFTDQKMSLYDKIREMYKSTMDINMKTIIQKLYKIYKYQNNCSKDILDCKSFLMMNECINCIILISKWFINKKDINIIKEDVLIFNKIKFSEFRKDIPSRLYNLLE